MKEHHQENEGLMTYCYSISHLYELLMCNFFGEQIHVYQEEDIGQ